MAVQISSGAATAENARRVLDFLVAHEATNNLPIRLVTGALDDAGALSRVWLGSVEREGKIVAAAACTWIKLALAASADLEAVAALGKATREELPDLPAVLGPIAEVEAFSDAWRLADGSSGRPGMSQRIYELTAVVPPRSAPGRARIAEPGDREVVARWYEEFSVEALGKPHEFSAADLDAQIEAEEILLWQIDSRLASLARGRRATPHGAVVGPVYTPPDMRGRGYASNVVAELARRLLAAGATSCFLYTDLANPTSNSIYQTVGYRPVCDVAELWFDEDYDPTWKPIAADPIG